MKQDKGKRKDEVVVDGSLLGADSYITNAQFTPKYYHAVNVVPEQPAAITIGSDPIDFMVKIHGNGKMEFGNNYNPDKAAIEFWNAVERQGRSWKSIQEENTKLHKQISQNYLDMKKMQEEIVKLGTLAEKATRELAEAHNKGELKQDSSTATWRIPPSQSISNNTHIHYTSTSAGR